MKKMILIFLFVFSFIFEYDAISAPLEKTNNDRLAEREEHLCEIGGYIDIIPDSPSVLIIDARKTPNDIVPKRIKTVMNGMLKLATTNIVVALSENVCPGIKGNEIRREGKHLLSIIICNLGKDKSALVVFPEERVAVVNEDAVVLFAKNEDANIRLIKECWRGIGFITGAGYSQNDAGVMQPVSSPLELDLVEWQVIHPMAFQQMNKFFIKYGAKRGRRTTYIKALEEGWAPYPTDKYQKAAWDRFMKKKQISSTNITPEKVSAPIK